MREFEEKIREDLIFDLGKIFGFMCIYLYFFVVKVVMKYIDRNFGDFGLYIGS